MDDVGAPDVGHPAVHGGRQEGEVEGAAGQPENRRLGVEGRHPGRVDAGEAPPLGGPGFPVHWQALGVLEAPQRVSVGVAAVAVLHDLNHVGLNIVQRALGL